MEIVGDELENYNLLLHMEVMSGILYLIYYERGVFNYEE